MSEPVRRPGFDDTDLERFLEGLPVDEQMGYAHAAMASIQRAEDVDADEFDDEISRLVTAMTGRTTVPIIVPWGDAALREPADEAIAALARAERAEAVFEVTRVLAAGWHPDVETRGERLEKLVERRGEKAEEAFASAPIGDSLDEAIENARTAARAVIAAVDEVEAACLRWHAALRAMLSVDEDDLRDLLDEDR